MSNLYNSSFNGVFFLSEFLRFRAPIRLPENVVVDVVIVQKKDGKFVKLFFKIINQWCYYYLKLIYRITRTSCYCWRIDLSIWWSGSKMWTRCFRHPVWPCPWQASSGKFYFSYWITRSIHFEFFAQLFAQSSLSVDVSHSIQLTRFILIQLNSSNLKSTSTRPIYLYLFFWKLKLDELDF